VAEELGALVIRIQADLAELRKGMSDAERIALAGGKTFEKVSTQIADQMRRIKGVDPKATTELRLLEQAMLRLQQKAPLTAAEIDRLAASTQRLAARGGEVPKALQAIVASSGHAQTSLSNLGGALGGVGSRLSAPLGQAGIALSAIGPAGMVAAVGVGVLVGAGIGLGKMAIDAGKFADELDDTARALGTSVEQLQKIREAGAQSDVGVDEMALASKKLQDNLASTPKLFDDIKGGAERLKAMDPSAALMEVVRAGQAYGDQASRTAFMTDAVGKAGAMLLKLDTHAGDAAASLGLMWSGSQASAAGAFGDQVEQLDRVWEGLWRNIGLSVAQSPELVQALKDITLALGGISAWVLSSGGKVKGFISDLILTAAAFDINPIKWGQQVQSFSKYRTEQKDTQSIDAYWKLKGQLSGGASTGTGGEYKSVSQRAAAEAAAAKAAAEALSRQRELTRELNSVEKDLYEQRKQAREDDKKYGTEFAKGLATITEANRTLAKAEVDRYDESLEAEERAGKEIVDDMFEAQKATERFAASIADLSSAFAALPGIAGSSLGNVLGKISGAEAAGKNLKAAFSPGVDAQGNAIKRDYVAGAIGVMGGVSALAGAYGAKTQGARVFGGAMAGAQAGAAFGPWGAAIGGALGGLGGLIIGDPSWAKAGKAAGKILGGAVSDESAKEIDARAKKFGIGRTEATLLDLSGGVSAAGGKMSAHTDDIVTLFNAIRSGAAPAAEGMTELVKSFAAIKDEGGFLGHPELIDRMMQAIRDGSVDGAAAVDLMASAFDSLSEGTTAGLAGSRKELLALIAEAKAGGVAIAGLKDYVTSTMSGAGADLATIFRGGATGAKDEAGNDVFSGGLVSGAGAAGMFGANFSAIRDSQGLLAAVSQLKDAWSLMSPEAQGQGNLSGLMALGGAGVSPIVEAGVALERNIGSLGNSGYMSKDAFTGAQAGALEYRKQLEGAGVGSGAALEAMGPMLAELLSSAGDYGLTLSDETLAMLADAKAAGVVFATDPTEKLTSVMVDQQIPAIEAQTRALEAMTRAMQGGGNTDISQAAMVGGGWNADQMRRAIMDGMAAVPLTVKSYLDQREITDAVAQGIASNVNGAGARVADGLSQQGRI
jgi:hypothetical protein